MNHKNYYVIDTNVLLDNADVIDEYENIIIPSAVLEEIDGLKKSESIGFKARQVGRKLDKEKKRIRFEIKDIYNDMPSGWDNNKRDNKIVMCALENNAYLISNDINVRVKAESVGVKSFWYNNKKKEIYTGYKEIYMNHEEQSEFYRNEYDYDFDLLMNQYLILKDEETNQVIDRFKMTENGLKSLDFKQITSRHMGKIKPKNLEQMFLFDLLQNKNITIMACTGKFGTGKDFCMISHALNMIENGKYEKLIWVRNVVEVKNSKEIGFLPGTADEKLMPFAMIISDHVGGKFGLELLIKEGKIELQHFGAIRGRDLKNSIIYCSEAENMTKEHIQLIIGRIGEGSILFLNGDYKQVDDKVFENNNGLNIMIEKLKGHKNFGFVQLNTTERSETAAMADLLD